MSQRSCPPTYLIRQWIHIWQAGHSTGGLHCSFMRSKLSIGQPLKTCSDNVKLSFTCTVGVQSLRSPLSDNIVHYQCVLPRIQTSCIGHRVSHISRRCSRWTCFSEQPLK